MKLQEINNFKRSTFVSFEETPLIFGFKDFSAAFKFDLIHAQKTSLRRSTLLFDT